MILKRITAIWKENPPDSPHQILEFKYFIIVSIKNFFNKAIGFPVIWDVLTPMWGHWNTWPIKADAGFNMDHFYFVNVLSAVGLANAMVNHPNRRTRIFHVCCIVSFHETYYKMHVGIRCRSRFSQCSPTSLKIWRISIYVTIWIDHDTVCAGVIGTAIRHSTSCCAGLQYQSRQRRPYKWSISILPRSQFHKRQGNLRFQRLVPLVVPIDVCVTTHDDGTASDVTIGMWRHNQQATNHERNGKPWFSSPK